MARATVLKRFEFDPELALHIETRAKAMEISQTAFVERLIIADRAQSNGGAVERWVDHEIDPEFLKQETREIRARIRTSIQTDSKPDSEYVSRADIEDSIERSSKPVSKPKRVKGEKGSTLDAVGPALDGGRGKASVETFSQPPCLHPSENRTAGKNWRCTACGYQNVAG